MFTLKEKRTNDNVIKKIKKIKYKLDVLLITEFSACEFKSVYY